MVGFPLWSFRSGIAPIDRGGTDKLRVWRDENRMKLPVMLGRMGVNLAVLPFDTRKSHPLLGYNHWTFFFLHCGHFIVRCRGEALRLNDFELWPDPLLRIHVDPASASNYSFQVKWSYRAYSTVRISRRTVILISPGKVISSLTRLAIFRAR